MNEQADVIIVILRVERFFSQNPPRRARALPLSQSPQEGASHINTQEDHNICWTLFSALYTADLQTENSTETSCLLD